MKVLGYDREGGRDQRLQHGEREPGERQEQYDERRVGMTPCAYGCRVGERGGGVRHVPSFLSQQLLTCNLPRLTHEVNRCLYKVLSIICFSASHPLVENA